MTVSTPPLSQLNPKVLDAERISDQLKESKADGATIRVAIDTWRQAKEAAKKAIEALQQRQKSCCVPRWVEACRDAFPTDKMKQFVNDDGKTWDTYTLLKIMQYHMSTVFLKMLGGDRHRAYELLRALVQVLRVRNNNSHQDTDGADQNMSEYEIMEALRLFGDLLQCCKLPRTELTHIQVLHNPEIMFIRAHVMVAIVHW